MKLGSILTRWLRRVKSNQFVYIESVVVFFQGRGLSYSGYQIAYIIWGIVYDINKKIRSRFAHVIAFYPF